MEEKDENTNNLNMDLTAIPNFPSKLYNKDVNVKPKDHEMSMESPKKHDVQIVALENQLRKVETDLLVSKEKMTFLEEKIKDKEDIIQALKASLDLYKNTDQPTANEYKAEISKQAAIVKIQEEKLTRLEAEKKFTKGMHYAKKNDCKLNMADLKLNRESEIKSRSDMLQSKVPLEYKGQISAQAALIKDLEEKLAKLELEDKSKKAFIRASQVKIGQHENTIKQLRQSIVDLKSLTNQNSDSKATIDGLGLKLQSCQAKLEENEKLLASYKAQLKDRDDQITLLELGNNLDSFKMKEKDDLLKELQKRMAKLN
ncbi:kinectin [Drosophila obscura]|uniref:kinectin n=1 Tax=Drosophila obscura TaxID=7282 RepID=UPI001BB0F336|nr:kinectin [Drosophila obscura]